MEQRESVSISSRAHLWWGCAWLLVPLLYFFMIPPVVFLSIRQASKSGAPRIPGWIAAYGAPYDWALEHTPFAESLEDYASWWDVRISEHGMP